MAATAASIDTFFVAERETIPLLGVAYRHFRFLFLLLFLVIVEETKCRTDRKRKSLGGAKAGVRVTLTPG